MKTGNHATRDALREAVLVDMGENLSYGEIAHRQGISQRVLPRVRGEVLALHGDELLDRAAKWWAEHDRKKRLMAP
jgi:hypothetical protein